MTPFSVFIIMKSHSSGAERVALKCNHKATTLCKTLWEAGPSQVLKGAEGCTEAEFGHCRDVKGSGTLYR